MFLPQNFGKIGVESKLLLHEFEQEVIVKACKTYANNFPFSVRQINTNSKMATLTSPQVRNLG
jgi:hypothetical protein